MKKINLKLIAIISICFLSTIAFASSLPPFQVAKGWKAVCISQTNQTYIDTNVFNSGVVTLTEPSSKNSKFNDIYCFHVTSNKDNVGHLSILSPECGYINDSDCTTNIVPYKNDFDVAMIKNKNSLVQPFICYKKEDSDSLCTISTNSFGIKTWNDNSYWTSFNIKSKTSKQGTDFKLTADQKNVWILYTDQNNNSLHLIRGNLSSGLTNLDYITISKVPTQFSNLAIAKNGSVYISYETSSTKDFNIAVFNSEGTLVMNKLVNQIEPVPMLNSKLSISTDNTKLRLDLLKTRVLESHIYDLPSVTFNNTIKPIIKENNIKVAGSFKYPAFDICNDNIKNQFFTVNYADNSCTINLNYKDKIISNLDILGNHFCSINVAGIDNLPIITTITQKKPITPSTFKTQIWVIEPSVNPVFRS